MRSKGNKPSGAGSFERMGVTSIGRILSMKVFLLLFFVVLAGRLVQIQVIDSSKYQEAARRQYEDNVDLPATRGSLYDRQGRVLVSSAMDVSFGADPKMLGKTATAVARRFSQTFGKPVSSYLDDLSPARTNFVWLERHARPEYANLIKAGDFSGIVQIQEPRRIYHYDEMAGQVLGFTDVDNKGISGVELQFDNVLRGKSGHMIMNRDGLGRRWAAVDYPRVDPVNGRSIVLTIDRDYQAIAEEELRKGIEQQHAESGLVVMLEPFSGRILAMVNYPSIDPSHPGSYDQSYTRNRAVTDMFEPGSVFKIVTASAALEKGVVKPEEKFYAEQGEYRVPGTSRTIKDFHPHGIVTFAEAMEVSSNIVMAKVSDRIGAESLFRTARDFGFGTETGIELPGEISGELKKPTEWWGTTLNSIAYGYDVGVTPIQLAAAYAVIANGGILYQPTILERELGDEKTGTDIHPTMIRRAISQKTAKTVADFLIGVVERGTGTQARIEGMTVAGKTGTARKVVNGKYATGSYTSTFAGFFPAENPRAVCVVMLDTHRLDAYTGGRISAPIFKNIAQKVSALSVHLSEETIAQADNDTLPGLPDVVNLKAENAVSLLESGGFEVELTGSGEFVLDQTPRPGTKLGGDDPVHLRTGDPRVQPGASEVIVPNLQGLSLRRAMSRLMIANLDMRAEGSGTVLSQTPSPGEKVKIKTPVRLRCKPGSFAAGPN